MKPLTLIFTFSVVMGSPAASASGVDRVPAIPNWLPPAMSATPQCNVVASNEELRANPSPNDVTVRIGFSDGVATTAAIDTPSGNPGFDHRVVECFRNLPARLTAKYVQNDEVPIKVYSFGGAISLRSSPGASGSMPATSNANTITVQHAPPASLSGVTTAASVGGPHMCDESLYPVKALQLSIEGRTLLAFEITPEGTTTNIRVENSSGSVDLDNAAASCAQTWRYRPATVNGVAVKISRKAYVVWTLGQEATPPFDQIYAAANFCRFFPAPDKDELDQATLATVLKIHFSNGAVTDVDVVASSGNSDLDLRAATCYRTLPLEITSGVTGDSNRLIQVVWRPQS